MARISNRVNHLVADAMLRQHAGSYKSSFRNYNAIFIDSEFTESNASLRDKVFLGMLNQFQALASHQSLASGSRMFDVVEALISNDPSLKNAIKNVAQESEIESGTSAFQHFEVFKKFNYFLPH